MVSVQFFQRAVFTFIVFLILTGCQPLSKTDFRKVEKEGDLKPNEKVETEEELPDYLKNLLANLKESPLIFSAANNGKGELVLIDSATDQVTKRFPFSEKIVSVRLKPDGSELYLATEKTNKILIFDLKNEKIVQTLNFKEEPASIAFLPDGKKVYITNNSSDYVSIFDTVKRKIVKTIKVGKHPGAITITFDGKKAYVGHSLYVDFSKTKPMKFRGITLPAGMPSFSEGAKKVAVIDLTRDKVIANLAINGYCNGLAVRPDNRLVYAAVSSVDVSGIIKGGLKTGGKDEILVIDVSSNKVVSVINFGSGSGPKSIAFTPDSKKAYVICGVGGDATVIDAQRHKIVKRVPSGIGV